MKNTLPSLLLSLCLATLAAPSSAQELKPYPNSKVSMTQWQQYHQKVAAQPGLKRIDVSVQKLEIYQDRATGMSVAFTRFGHPAHPAWISRRLNDLPSGMEIEQVGYYAGNKDAFERLNADFHLLNEDLIAQSRAARAPAGQ